MGFLGAAFLGAIPLIAVPAAIHLFARRKKRPVAWGAMELLFETKAERRRVSRLDDLLLMLLRIAAVLLFVLALARPTAAWAWLGGGAGREVVIAIDRSLSTTAAVGAEGESAFAEIKGRVAAVIAACDDGDSVRLVEASVGPVALTPAAVRVDAESRRGLLATAEGLEPAGGVTDWPAVLRGVLEQEPDAGAAVRHVIAVTDGTAAGWGRAAERAALGSAIETAGGRTVVSVITGEGDAAPDATRVGNFAVGAVTPRRATVGEDEAVTLSARVHNFSDESLPPATVEWTRGQTSLGVSTVPVVEAGGTADVTITLPGFAAGRVKIDARLDVEDAVSGDDVGSTLIDVVERVAILVVVPDGRGGRKEANYVVAAMGRPLPGAGRGTGKGDRKVVSAFRPDVVTAGELEGVEFGSYAACLLLGPGPLDGAVRGELLDAVRGGTGLWFAPTPASDPDTFAEAWVEGETRLTGVTLGPAVGNPDDLDAADTVSPPEDGRALTELLGDTDRLDITEVRVARRFGLSLPDDAAARADVLLRTGRGEPLAVETAFGRGRVIVQGVPHGLRWSNLPLCQVYVAMVHEFLWHLAAPSRPAAAVAVGEPLVAPFGGAGLDVDAFSFTEIAVDTPAGRTRRYPRRYGDEGPFRFTETGRPGVYEVASRNADRPEDVSSRLRFLVTRPAEESDLTPLGARERETLAGAGLVFDDAPLATATAAVPVGDPRPAWGPVLWTLLAIVAAEGLLMLRTTAVRFLGTRSGGVV